MNEGNSSDSQIEAYFAEDLPEFESLRQFSGVDGFLLKTDGLYQVNSGYQWYLQVGKLTILSLHVGKGM